MECDLIYPEDIRDMHDVGCIVAAAYFDDDELLSFGVDKNSYEVREQFINYNEFEKPFALWASLLYLSDFFDKHKSFFEQNYWSGIKESDFVKDVMKSRTSIFKTLIDSMQKGSFGSLVEPLDSTEEEKRIFDSIKVKIKQGVISGHYSFRFYAIEVEEGCCYLITGATIKVHKDMGKAPNTKIELKKLSHVLNVLKSNDVDTKDTFIDYFKKQQ